MPLESLFTNPNPDVPRSRSLLSRLSSPLSQNANKMFEVAIEPADPFKVYSPGEVVRGHIVLTVVKGFAITHLVVSLHGYAKVFKHQIAPGEKAPVQERLANGRGSRGFEYHGNGLASLFQEEQILCGNGFLKKQVYKFAFELRFPAKSMPSTIEFERGTVSYMISATVTRPVALQPIHTKYKRIKFQDTIDIETMNTPKTRVISLEPVNRLGKVKKVKHSSSVSTQEAASAGRLSRKNTQSSSITSATIPIGNPPLSPAPSEDTVVSMASASSTSFQQVENDNSPTRKPTPETSDTRSTTTSSSAHTITATTELPRHGALPGDSIPVRVSVAHSKPSMRGAIIATLYRLARVDMHPAIPLASQGRDKDPEYEDIYPKSRTGLGGLYFASSAPSSVFRKDLSQSSTMMVINPITLTADVSTSVKVPETAFPSITNVPGGMISFTYHIEVVIDLFGKLGETRYLPRLTSTDPNFTASEAGGNQMTNDWSNSILDTAQLRRTKSVVTFEMSVTVGTRDSSRNRRRTRPEDLENQENAEPNQNQDWSAEGWHDGWGYEGYDWYYDENGEPQWSDASQYNDWEGYHEGYGGHVDNTWQDNRLEYPPPTANMIYPLAVHEEVDEKTRLRRQEELLMPSQPPQEGESSFRASVLAPSAPILHDDADLAAAHNYGIAPPSTPGPPASVTSARSADTIRPHSTSPPPMPITNTAVVTEDKQELERRRLMEQASAPPVEEEEDVTSDCVRPPVLEPSAPLLSEDDFNDPYATSVRERQGSFLPQYQR